MSSFYTYVLVISCPDGPGIVASVASLLRDHECNILEVKEFSDLESVHFFMRCEFISQN